MWTYYKSALEIIRFLDILQDEKQIPEIVGLVFSCTIIASPKILYLCSKGVFLCSAGTAIIGHATSVQDKITSYQSEHFYFENLY